MSKRFERVETQAAAISPTKLDLAGLVPPSLQRYTDDVAYQYEDFARQRDEGVKTFRVQVSPSLDRGSRSHLKRKLSFLPTAVDPLN